MKKSIQKKEYKILLEQLYTLRTESGMRQVDLAKKLDVHQSFVSKYEIGERRLDLVELHEVCNALGVDLGDFVRRYEEALK